MSIQTELTRLTNAKAAIQAAVEGKGVTVPSGTLLDGMAALIDAIEAGGLQNNRMLVVNRGSFTVNERIAFDYDHRYILHHGCGLIPLLIKITGSTDKATSDLKSALFWRIRNLGVSTSSNVNSIITRRASSRDYAEAITSEMGTLSGDNWTTEHASLVSYGVTAYFNTGITYNWVAYYAE